MIMMWIVAGIYLVVGSIFDKKSMTLPGWFLGLGILLGIFCGLYRMLSGQLFCEQWIKACLPGILWMVLSFGTREQMGCGDGVVLLVLGSLTDIGTTFMLLLLGLVSGCILGVLILVTRKGNRHTAIPFVPMLLLAYGLVTGGRILF